MILRGEFRSMIQSGECADFGRLIGYVDPDWDYLDMPTDGDTAKVSVIPRPRIEEYRLLPSEGARIQFRAKFGVKLKLSKILARCGYSSSELEMRNNSFLCYFKDPDGVEIVEYDEIRYKIYDTNNFFPASGSGGTLYGSCMNNDSYSLFYDYMSHPEHPIKGFALLVDGKIVGRSLLWKGVNLYIKTDSASHDEIRAEFPDLPMEEYNAHRVLIKNVIFMDRFYDISSKFCNIATKYAKENGWLYKTVQSYGMQMQFGLGEAMLEGDDLAIVYDARPRKDVDWQKASNAGVPYIDTLHHVDLDNMMLGSKHSHHVGVDSYESCCCTGGQSDNDYSIACDGGWDDNGGGCYCNRCDERYPEEDMRTVLNRHGDCVDLCIGCFDDYAVQCPECNEWFENGDMLSPIGESGDYYCEACIDKFRNNGDIIECAHCGSLAFTSDTEPIYSVAEDDMKDVCAGCASRHYTSSCLNCDDDIKASYCDGLCDDCKYNYKTAEQAEPATPEVVG